MTIILGLLVWFATSIPVSLALGAVLGRDRTPSDLRVSMAAVAGAPEVLRTS